MGLPLYYCSFVAESTSWMDLWRAKHLFSWPLLLWHISLVKQPQLGAFCLSVSSMSVIEILLHLFFIQGLFLMTCFCSSAQPCLILAFSQGGLPLHASLIFYPSAYGITVAVPYMRRGERLGGCGEPMWYCLENRLAFYVIALSYQVLLGKCGCWHSSQLHITILGYCSFKKAKA